MNAVAIDLLNRVDSVLLELLDIALAADFHCPKFHVS